MTYHVQFPGLGLAFTVNRVAVSIGGFNIYWYGVVIAAGMLLAIKGDFPKDKEPLVYGRCRFLVLDIADHRITSVRVKVMADIQKI